MARVVVSGEYVSSVFNLPFETGGISFAKNELSSSPALLGEESLNVDIAALSKSKRKGTEKFYEQPLSLGRAIVAMISFNDNLYFFTTEGKIWKNDLTEEVKTTSPSDEGCFAISQKRLFFANGIDIPFYTDSTDEVETWYDVTPPTDWETNKPKYLFSQTIGNTSQLWAFGCSGVQANRLYAPNAGDNKDFSDNNVFTLSIGNANEPIIALKEYGDALLTCSLEHTYLVDISDVSRTNWSYKPASWKGGASSHKAMVAAKNDVIVYNNLDIYAVSAVQTVAEYRMASISRPAQIDTFIEAHIPLSSRSCFSVYDEKKNSIMFFFSSTSYALVLFMDTLDWTIYQGMNNPTSAFYYQDTILLGCSDGHVRKLGFGNNDDGEPYDCVISTRHLQINDKIYRKHYITASLYLNAITTEGEHPIEIWIDGCFAFSTTITTIPSGFILSDTPDTCSKMGDYLVPLRRFYLQDIDLQCGGHTIKFIIRPDSSSEEFSILALDIYYAGYGATSDMSISNR